MNPSYTSLFRALLPEGILVAGAGAVLAADLTAVSRWPAARRRCAALLIASAAAAAALILAWLGPRGPVYGGVLMLDPLAVGTRVAVLGLLLLSLGLTSAATLRPDPAEFIALMMLAGAGFLAMAAAQQLLVAFLALELASLSLYVLAGYDRRSPASAEAGLKYFLVGGMASAFLLFGLSLVYGSEGTLELPRIAALAASHGLSPLLRIGLAMTVVALGFKTAAAPFHFWAPDVYEGAPASATVLISSASKLAALVLFARLLGTGFGAAGWPVGVAVLSAASLLIGNLGALGQTNLRRLLGYSSVAHAGALMLALLILPKMGPAPLWFYAVTYALATLGAFGVIAVLEAGGECQKLSDLAGLWRRSPLLGACLAVFVLSLAGIPPLAGFFGKFAVFATAFSIGGLGTVPGWLALAGIALTAVGLYYYLRILKQVLLAPAAAPAAVVALPRAAGFSLVAAAVLLVVFGLFPALLLNRL